MRLTIVHYHLRRGGVTRVIETALEGLRKAGIEIEVTILSGESPYPGSPLADHCRVIPGLSYRNELGSESEIALLADELETEARDSFAGSPDVWHVHNHSLGKNVAMPGVVQALAGRGARLLLQIHDFAEDGRPGNFLRQRAAIDPATLSWYPEAPQVHYAALNQRDADFLGRSGLPDDRLHLLPNAVAPPPCDREAGPPDFVKPGQRFLLYPTRGIRRKNLGEMLLLSVLAGDDCAFASTLAPENPEWLAIHDRWEAFAGRHDLPARLGIGADPSLSFGGLVGSADALVTTSVAEGFGLAFLEPWLVGKTVRGRDLPEITADFSGKGVRLDGLYPRFEVPAAAFDTDLFRARLSEGLRSAYASYGRALPADGEETAFSAAFSGDRADFGRLDEDLQQQVLEWAVANPGRARDAVETPDLSAAPDDLREANASAVSEHYGVAAYGRRLAEVYRAIGESPTREPGSLDGDRLLDAFLDPARFTLLRS